MRKTIKKVLTLCMTVAILTGMMGSAASATGKMKVFTLPCGDSVTLSNYVDERMEELVLNGQTKAVTYHLVDENTQIIFNMNSGNAVEGDILQGELVGVNEYEIFPAYYLGGNWGWPEDYPALAAFKFSVSNNGEESSTYFPLAGISITDFDSKVIRSEDGKSYGYSDRVSFYMMRAEQPTPTNIQAVPTASNMLVNGKQTAFDAYNIGGNNYFKLRDLAYALNGSEKQFEVTWDQANNAILLTSGKTYTPVGDEMEGKGAGAKTAISTSSKILMKGKEIALTAYNIGGNNYFKLRDIGQTFDFSVIWDGTKNTISIDTTNEYTE